MSRRGNSGKRSRNEGGRRGYGPTGFESHGGYMAAKIAKLSNQFDRVAESNFGEERRGIFRGVAIFVNGYTEPTAEELKRIMLAHGGTFHHYYSRSKTTHIIANNLPDTKIKNMNTDRIVSPKWISESLKVGHLLDFTKFVLYTNQSSKQPKISFKRVPSSDSASHQSNSESSCRTIDDKSIASGLSQDSEKSGKVTHNYTEDEDLFADLSDPDERECKTNLENSDERDLFSDVPEMRKLDDNSRLETTKNKKGIEGSSAVPSGVKTNVKMSKEYESEMNEDEDLFSDICLDEEIVNKSEPKKVSKNYEDEDLFADTEEVSKDTANSMPSNKSTNSNSKSLNPSVDKKVDSKTVTGESMHGSSRPVQSVQHNTSPSKSHSLSTANPKFLSEFYNNSRLHHISTMGATFKQYVTDMQSRKEGFPERDTLKEWAKRKRGGDDVHRHDGEELKEAASKTNTKTKRTIMHIDMDCFFVSVGLRNHPNLRGKPVAVTHARGGGRGQAREGVDRQYELNYYKERAEKRLQGKIKSTNVGKTHESFTLPNKADDESENAQQGEISEWKPPSSTLKFSTLPLIDDTCSMSEIASCSYEARKAGVRNGMFMGPALKLCPDLKTIPYDFEGYKEVAYKLYDIVAKYTHDIEAVSCDEMYVDLTELLSNCKVSPLDFASYLREEVQEATGCPCSAGMGPNMLIARMATRKAKPKGQHMADPNRLSEYMMNEKVTELPGVGWSLGKRLESQNIKTCADLQVKSLAQLQALFGAKTGQSLYYYCRGIDDRPVKSEHVRKSVSAEVNYGIRFTCQADAERFIGELATEVENRLNAVNLKGKCITLKLKVRAKDAPVETAKFMGHGVCDNIAKSVSLGAATSSSSTIEREVMTLLRQIKVPPQDFRGVGIQVSRLEGRQGHSASGPSSTTSIKSFMLSSKTKNQKNSTDPPQKNSEVSGANSEMGPHTNIAERSDFKHSISGKSQPSTSTGKPPTVSNTGLSTGQPPMPSTSAKESVPPNKGAIDLEVLMALPEDMREQVLAEYRQQGYTIPNSYQESKGTESQTILDPQPSTSFASVSTNEAKQSKGIGTFEGTNKSKDSRPVPLQQEETQASLNSDDDDEAMITSFSQVDSSFLAAIPEEMREELKKDFEYKKKQASGGLPHQKQSINGRGRARTTGQSTVNDLRRTVFEKPLGKTAAPQPIRGGKRRGRPPKTMGQSTRKSPVKSNKKAVITSPRKINVSDPVASLPLQENNGGISSQDSSVDGFSVASCGGDKEDNAEHKPQKEETPNLCGAVELSEVKSLIGEWVSSCPNPEEEDIDIIATYYSSLVTFRDLEKVDLLLKHLYRQVLRTHNRLWQLAYNNVIDRVQSVMLYQYEVKLKVNYIVLEETS